MDYNETKKMIDDHLKAVRATAVSHMNLHPGAISSVLVYLESQGIIKIIKNEPKKQETIVSEEVLPPYDKLTDTSRIQTRNEPSKRYPITLYKKTMSLQCSPLGHHYYSFSKVRSSMISGGYNTVQLDIITPNGSQFRATLTLNEIPDNINVSAWAHGGINLTGKWSKYFKRV